MEGARPTAMTLPPAAVTGGDLAERVEGDAVGGWEDEDLVGAEADLVDGVGVDEVDVVAGGEDGGHQRGRDERCMAPVTVTWRG